MVIFDGYVSLPEGIPGWWFQTFFYVPFHIWVVILPIDELIFFRGIETTNQIGCTLW